MHLRLQVFNAPQQVTPLIILLIPYLCQLVPEFLLNLLKHHLLLRHLALHVLELFGQVLARVLPLAAHLPLSRLESLYLRLQLSRLAVLPVDRLLQRSDLSSLSAQLISLPGNFSLQIH